MAYLLAVLCVALLLELLAGHGRNTVSRTLR